MELSTWRTKMSKKLFLLLICMLVVITFVYSCGEGEVKIYTQIENTGGDRYTLFDAEKAIPRFSFEYPSDYQLSSYQPMPAISLTSVILSVPNAEVSKIKSVEIYVQAPYEALSDAEAYMKYTINNDKKDVRNGFVKDFKIIEKNKMIIGEIQGWELIVSFYVTGKPVHGFDDASPTERPVVSRYLFFDYRGMIWKVIVSSTTDVADQAKLDYEHIIQTFKILD
jgi:hypothetical protein